jgi:hypothetical protein
MTALEKDIIRLLEGNPGLTDKELAEAIQGHKSSTQYINQNCRRLESQDVLIRKKRDDGLLGNWLNNNHSAQKLLLQAEAETLAADISEKRIKQVLEQFLESRGWKYEITWNHGSGTDIEARRGSERWIIQVKGSGLFQPASLNNFLSVLGEIVQRMDDPGSKYSIALPDLEQFHRLWERLPGLAKARISVTALFVDIEGRITEEG